MRALVKRNVFGNPTKCCWNCLHAQRYAEGDSVEGLAIATEPFVFCPIAAVRIGKDRIWKAKALDDMLIADPYIEDEICWDFEWGVRDDG